MTKIALAVIISVISLQTAAYAHSGDKSTAANQKIVAKQAKFSMSRVIAHIFNRQSPNDHTKMVREIADAQPPLGAY